MKIASLIEALKPHVGKTFHHYENCARVQKISQRVLFDDQDYLEIDHSLEVPGADLFLGGLTVPQAIEALAPYEGFEFSVGGAEGALFVSEENNTVTLDDSEAGADVFGEDTVKVEIEN